MKILVRRQLPIIAWTLGVVVTALSIGIWGSFWEWDVASLDAYGWFPLFGLLAFSLMWTHYIIVALCVYANDAPKVRSYSTITGWIVFFSLLAHPGLLAVGLYQDGLGLPPLSYQQIVGPTLYGFVVLGILAWLTFILYEIKRKFGQRPWWRYVLGANAIAMLAIVVHGWQLGTHIQTTWFRSVWIIYSVGLVIAFVYLIAKNKLTDIGLPVDTNRS